MAPLFLDGLVFFFSEGGWARGLYNADVILPGLMGACVVFWLIEGLAEWFQSIWAAWVALGVTVADGRLMVWL